MPDEFVTKSELNAALLGLERKMDKGFADLAAQIVALGHLLVENQHKDREFYDERYQMRQDAMGEAIERVGNPTFRRACYPIVSEWLDTPDGMLKLGCIIDKYFAEKRDNTVKWMGFFKAIVATIVLGSFLYGGNTVIKSNQVTQKAVIELLNKGE